MSQENVEATRAAFERYSRGDFSWFLDRLPDDFELVTAAEMPDGGTYRGDAARDWITAYNESFDGFTMEASEIIDATDKVVVAIVQRGRPHGSDAPVESRWWQVATFQAEAVTRVEQIVKVQFFADKAAALEAAGLTAP